MQEKILVNNIIDPINLEKNSSEVDLGLRWLNLSGTMSKIHNFERKKILVRMLA